MLAALIENLEKLITLGASPAPEDVADALWLASQLGLPSIDAASSLATSKKVADNRNAMLTKPTFSSPLKTFSKTSSDREIPIVTDGAKDIDVPHVPFRTPAATALPHALELSRALRPLRRRIPSRFQFVLDEDATAQSAAEEGRWYPILRPVAERWLNLAIVVDEGPSMQVWRSTTQALRRLLERQGIARDIRSWRLDTAVAGQVRLLNAAARASTHRVQEVSDASGRRLVIIVSDCVSPAWWGPAMVDALRLWSRHQPVSLIQMFPQRLWVQTALGAASLVTVRTPRLASPARALVPVVRRRPRRLRGTAGSPAAPPLIPVTTLEPELMHVWSRFMGSPAGGIGPAVRISIPSADLKAKEEHSAEAAVERFQARASPLTFQLACHLAAAPLQLPVMRLVQRSLLTTSGQVHLAEFLASGLIQRSSSTKQDDEETLWDFKPGIRDALLNAGTFTTHIEVQRQVSKFIASRFGQAMDFGTYLIDPAALLSSAAISALRPFAAVSAAVLRRLGGRYREVVEGIASGKPPEQIIDPLRDPSKDQESSQAAEITNDSSVLATTEIPPGKRWWRFTRSQKEDILGATSTLGLGRFEDPGTETTSWPRWRAIYLAGTFKGGLDEIVLHLPGIAEAKGVIAESALVGYDWIEFDTIRSIRVADLRSESNQVPLSAQSAEQTRRMTERCFNEPETLDGILFDSPTGTGDFLVLFDVRVQKAFRISSRHNILSARDDLVQALANHGLQLEGEASDVPNVSLPQTDYPWVLVAGTGDDDLRAAEASAAMDLGETLASCGYGLITGGWPGVDERIARSFATTLERHGVALETRLIQVVAQDSVSPFHGGHLVNVPPGEEEYRVAIEHADAVVIIGGAGGTLKVAYFADRAGRPVIPLPTTGGDARTYYDHLAKAGYSPQTSWSLTPHEIDRLAEPASGMAEIVLEILERLAPVPIVRLHTYDRAERYYNPPQEVTEQGRQLDQGNFYTLVSQLKSGEVLIGVFRNPAGALVATHLNSRQRLVEVGTVSIDGVLYFALSRASANSHWKDPVPARDDESLSSHIPHRVDSNSTYPPRLAYSLVPVDPPPSILYEDPPENHGPHVVTRGPHRLEFTESFRMGEYLVTNELFLQFVRAGGYRDERLWNTGARRLWLTEDQKTQGPSTWPSADIYPAGLGSHPVAGVSFLEAEAFVRWLEVHHTDPEWVWCLPTEDMWELSARSPRGHLYPWGNSFLSDHCNSEESKIGATSDVRAFESGRSEYHCADMAGNVWEFVSAIDAPSGTCVLRGGSFKNDGSEIRSYLRLINVHESLRAADFGFRCAQVRRLSERTADPSSLGTPRRRKTVKKVAKKKSPKKK